MPHLDTTYYFSQFFWLIISFSILLLVVSYVFIPRVRYISRKRQLLITKLRRDADKMLKLSLKIKREAEEIKQKTLLDTKQMRESLFESLKSEFEIKQVAIQQQIIDLKKQNELKTEQLKAEFDKHYSEKCSEMAAIIIDKLTKTEDLKD